jgi:hypothetical protein
MAVQFTTGSAMYTDFGSAADIDNLTTKTALVLVRVDGASFINPSHLITKKVDGGTGAGWAFSFSGTTGAVRFLQRMASDNYSYISGDNLGAPITTWRWIGFTFDPNAGAGVKAKLYGGPYAGALAETATYSTSTDAASGANSDASQSLRVANVTTAATGACPTAAFERACLWNVVLTLPQMQAHIDGTQHAAGILLDARMGWDGATTAADLSGIGRNGTTTLGSNTAGIDQARIVRAGFHHRNH